jgi:pyruvate dehydrogenase E1 component alpha subunit
LGFVYKFAAHLKKSSMAKRRITKKIYLKWYEDMLFWRKFEDMAAALYIQQKIRGFLHLYNGQEAVLAGSLQAMELGDKMITAYRNHVQPIGMGVDPRKIMAELMGKQDGTSHGKGGSMHMFSKEYNFFGGHGIVGGQIPLGAGLAFADKYHGNNHVTLTYMGDGAVRQGSFHETLNLAMLWNLPVVFIIENNGYAMGTSVQRTASHTDIYKLGLGYEMPCDHVDGMHPEMVYDKVYEAVERARKGGGPTLLEARTYRYKGHSMSDAQHYRTKTEVAEYQKLDPITQVEDLLKEKKWATEDQIKEIQTRVKALVKECVDFAEASPFAPAEYTYKGVYVQDDYPFIKE